MKLILAGATGFIGNEVLTQALSHPKVTSVVALSRRPLTGPLSSHPKLQTALMTDETYISYPPEVLSQLADASGAVWALGIAFPKEQEIYRRVNVDYTKAAAQTLGKMASEGSMAEGRFRFAYCSGALPERDQEKKLWFLEEGRKLRVCYPCRCRWKRSSLSECVPGLLTNTCRGQLRTKLCRRARTGGMRWILLC